MREINLILFPKKEIKGRIIVWFLITILVCLIDPVIGDIKTQILGTGLIMIAYMFVYYTNFLFLFHFKRLNKLVIYIILTTLTFVIYTTINFFNLCYILSIVDFESLLNASIFFDWAISCLILFSIVSVIAYGFYQTKMSIYKLHIEHEKEKTIMNRELAFYKSQFNPHITFNFLNYCYSFLNKVSNNTADVIELFSDMLRYTTNNKADKLVLLADEVAYINNFITLKKKLSNNVHVVFNVIGDTNKRKILPRILITFVENAFKHGETNFKETPIVISLNLLDSQIKFKIHNVKNSSKHKPISTGIGQLNVKKHLDIFYKNKYQLVVTDTVNEYNATLIIDDKF